MIAHTTAFVTPFVEHWLEREISQWVWTIRTILISNIIKISFGRIGTIRRPTVTPDIRIPPFHFNHRLWTTAVAKQKNPLGQ